MDKEKAHDYIHNVMFKEWLPVIHSVAKKVATKYGHLNMDQSDLHQELYTAGLHGLVAAFKNFDPKIAKARKNTFKTYAIDTIRGHMENHAYSGSNSSQQSEQAVDPYHVRQAKLHEKASKLKANPVREIIPPKIPSTPDDQDL